MRDILSRVKGIVLTPQAEWPAVARETGNGRCLLYMAVLAVIPPLARFVGATLIGGYTPLVPGLTAAALTYALTFAIVYAVALLVDMLALTFEGERDFPMSLRLTVYSFTPVWLAGIFLLVPGASFLTLLGLYGFFPLWAGLQFMKKVRSNKALFYAMVVTAWAFALVVIVNVTVLATFAAQR